MNLYGQIIRANKYIYVFVHIYILFIYLYVVCKTNEFNTHETT